MWTPKKSQRCDACQLNVAETSQCIYLYLSEPWFLILRIGTSQFHHFFLHVYSSLRIHKLLMVGSGCSAANITSDEIPMVYLYISIIGYLHIWLSLGPSQSLQLIWTLPWLLEVEPPMAVALGGSLEESQVKRTNKSLDSCPFFYWISCCELSHTTLWWFNITMENHHFQWVNPLEIAIFHSYCMLSYQSVSHLWFRWFSIK